MQQIDSGAFADDDAQHRWLERAGFTKVRTWWQMSRPVTPEEADRDAEAKDGRADPARCDGEGTGMPDEDDLRTVHDILESVVRRPLQLPRGDLRRVRLPAARGPRPPVGPLVDRRAGRRGTEPEPAGALVGAVSRGRAAAQPDGSYVEYLGVLQSARGRGVAKSLLGTMIADAASRGRDRVGLEVDADSPTGADGLYLSMGWKTRYVTESWHRDVPVTD